MWKEERPWQRKLQVPRPRGRQERGRPKGLRRRGTEHGTGSGHEKAVEGLGLHHTSNETPLPIFSTQMRGGGRIQRRDHRGATARGA